MDAVLMRLADKAGDWLQETRGIPLPSILMNITLTYITVLLVFIASLSRSSSTGSLEWGGIGLSVINLLVWAPTIVIEWQALKKYALDVDMFDDTDVRKRYENAALFQREHNHLVRMLSLWFFGTCSCLLAMMIMVHSLDSLGEPVATRSLFFSHTSLVVLFGLATCLWYAKCMIPKVPRQKRELRLATVESGI